MSRVGKNPIPLVEGVSVSIDDNKVGVEGPKGKLTVELLNEIKVTIAEGYIIVALAKKSKARNLHGLFRSLVYNAVIGVSRGWSKTLELHGVGFKAKTIGRDLELHVGFSHSVKIVAPEGINIEVKNKRIIVSGVDKYLVGEMAATIRRAKPPDSYKGKGIRYEGEQVRIKPGKAAKGIGGGLGK